MRRHLWLLIGFGAGLASTAYGGYKAAPISVRATPAPSAPHSPPAPGDYGSGAGRFQDARAGAGNQRIQCWISAYPDQTLGACIFRDAAGVEVGCGTTDPAFLEVIAALDGQDSIGAYFLIDGKCARLSVFRSSRFSPVLP